MSLIRGLNPEQREAVEHREGPMLVVAGAGTGKTRVITTRLAWLIREVRVKPQEILALTFADRAAAEMEARVDELIPYAYTDFWISTFHAFGDRVLREYAVEIGLTPQFRVLSQAEQLLFLREHLFDLPLARYRPLGNPTKHLEALLGVIGRAKDEDVTPEEFLALAEARMAAAQDEVQRDEAERLLELARVYGRYQALLAEEGRVDFGDLIGLTLKLFRTRPAVLAAYQHRFRQVMVDEFQDTNYAQLQLVLLLSGVHRNVMVVGDDDQSIFKWRGAAVSNIMKFLDAFPTAKRVVLTRNYRSRQEILDRAYELIRHNDPDRLEVKYHIPKKLTAEREAATEGSSQRDTSGSNPSQREPRGSLKGSGKGVVWHHHFDTVDTEADGVADRIASHVKGGDRTYRDMAVLVRSNKDADPFLRALNVKGIPWQFSGNAGLYEQEEVRWMISFLRALASVHDTPQVYDVAVGPGYRVPALDMVKCLHQAHRTHRSLWTVIERLGTTAEELGVSSEGRLALEQFQASLLTYVDVSQRLSVGEVLYRYVMERGLLNMLMDQQTPAAELKIKNMAKFFERVKRYTEDFPRLRSAPQFTRYLDLLQEAGDDPKVAEADADLDAVNILTLHSAKGLEFPVVYMVSQVSDRFPMRFRREALSLPDALVKDTVPSGDVHLQEERRLCYVGMTRAMDELHMTSAADYGGRRLKKVGQFVAEALNLGKAQVVSTKATPRAVIERFAPPAEIILSAKTETPVEGPLTLSYYHMNDYTTCPLKYKFAHVLRVPILPHHSVVYGFALHEAVKGYHVAKMAGRPCSYEEVLAWFEGAWRSEGFLSRVHEEQRQTAGREALKRFVETEDQNGVIPAMVEKEFTFFVGDIRVVGRWDRVDVIDPGDVVIRDFKSSAIRDLDEANERAEDSVQLGLYALAYREVFGKLPDREELYFLESGIVGATKKNSEDLDEVRKRLTLAAEGIRARRFQATPSARTCQWCVFREICPDRAS